MNLQELRLRGKITIVSPGEIIVEGIDGITRIRDRSAFKKAIFAKGEEVTVTIEIVMDKAYVDSVMKHPTKMWTDQDGVILIGVVNEIARGGVSLKELKEGESPFLRKLFPDEKGWISNDKYLEDFDVNFGDVLKIQIKRKKT